MRKHVTPAHPAASIPDLERADFLPPEGRTVSWNPYWATMLIREEIAVGEPVEETAPEAAAPEVAPEVLPGA